VLSMLICRPAQANASEILELSLATSCDHSLPESIQSQSRFDMYPISLYAFRILPKCAMNVAVEGSPTVSLMMAVLSRPCFFSVARKRTNISSSDRSTRRASNSF